MHWVVAFVALAGVVLNIKRHVSCFYLWSISNAFWACVDFDRGLHAQAALMAVYFFLSLWGIWKWTPRGKGASHGKENSP